MGGPAQAELKRAREAASKARALREAGDVVLAGLVYAHSLEWADTAEARLGLAWTCAYAGRLEEAMEQCRRAVLLDPEDGRASNDLGVYLMQQGLDEEALPHLAQAAQSRWNPERHFPHYNLGRIHERRGELEDAEAAYQAALLEDPAFDAAAKALERVRRKRAA